MARVIALALAALTLCAVGSAAAQTREDEARAAFEAGRLAYEAGNFEAALQQFRAAYEGAPRPLLLYNIGQAADRLRRDAETLEAFESFLAAVGPSDPHYAGVQARVTAIRAALGTEPDPTPDTPAAHEPSPVPWIIAGAGLAVVGGGLAMVLVASADATAVNEAPAGSSWADYESAANNAGPLSVAGQVMIYVGAAAVAGGLIWGIIDLSSGDGGEEVALEVRPGGLALRGSFR